MDKDILHKQATRPMGVPLFCSCYCYANIMMTLTPFPPPLPLIFSNLTYPVPNPAKCFCCRCLLLLLSHQTPITNAENNCNYQCHSCLQPTTSSSPGGIGSGQFVAACKHCQRQVYCCLHPVSCLYLPYLRMPACKDRLSWGWRTS